MRRRGLDPQSLRDAQGQTPLAHAQGDRAVLAALRAKPTKALKADEADTPTRPHPPRAGVVAAYALASAAAWAAPFFLAWYWALPLLAFTSLLLSLARRHAGGGGGGGHHRHASHPQPSSHAQVQGGRGQGPSPLARWVGSTQEAYPGFWLGTLVAYAAADPVLRFWPHSVKWGKAGGGGGEMVTAAPGDPPFLGGGGLVAMNVLFAATLLLWVDLVFWRADAGAVPSDGRAFDETLARVAATAAPPPESHTCPTCLVRKPLRSKVCTRDGWRWLQGFKGFWFGWGHDSIAKRQPKSTPPPPSSYQPHPLP